MIPMLEIGHGDACIFCVAGFSGTDGQMTDRLTRMALELCRIYECNWTVDELYEVKKAPGSDQALYHTGGQSGWI